MTTTIGAHPAPVFDITPRAGQTDDEIDGWFRFNFPNGPTDMSERLYWGSCLKDRPTDDKSDPAYYAWHERLTPRQREIAEIAKEKKSTDPKEVAARKARRAKDIAYQIRLSEERANYRAKAELEGRQVRKYEKGAVKSDAERKEDQRRRTDRLNARIRQDLAERRNPFPLDRFDSASEKKATSDKHFARYLICEFILRDDSFDPSSDVHRTAISKFLDMSEEEAHHIMVGAINSLRAAGAIRRSGGKAFLHGDVLKLRAEADREADLDEIKHLPGFGIA